MAILGRATLPGCACCGDPYLVVGACQSLTGSAALYGFSGYSSSDPLRAYDPDNPSVWEGQLRKWTKRKLSGYMGDRSGDCTDCPQPATTESGGWDFTYSGTAIVTAASSTPATRTYAEIPFASCTPNSPTAESIYSLRDDVNRYYSVAICPAAYASSASRPVLETRSLTTMNWEGCGCVIIEDGRGYLVSGTADEELEQERFLYDALADKLNELGEESGVTEGESCCAELVDASLTAPELRTDAISMEGTAVRIPLSVVGCEAGAEFSVIVTLSQGEGEDYDEFQVEVGVMCGTPTHFYLPLPFPGDAPICFVSAALAA